MTPDDGIPDDRILDIPYGVTRDFGFTVPITRGADHCRLWFSADVEPPAGRFDLAAILPRALEAIETCLNRGWMLDLAGIEASFATIGPVCEWTKHDGMTKAARLAVAERFQLEAAR